MKLAIHFLHASAISFIEAAALNPKRGLQAACEEEADVFPSVAIAGAGGRGLADKACSSS